MENKEKLMQNKSAQRSLSIMSGGFTKWKIYTHVKKEKTRREYFYTVEFSKTLNFNNLVCHASSDVL